ncbi:MAG: CPBP family intramembrane metalloprotease [Leptolyngbyaceae cyanobacterium SM2_3_12]|nr:CPBP family intramembrane metalloprotease [Leptolyngbyaceae cyanobacterium SM2_3_12]
MPSEQEYANTPGDWAWIEVWHGPAEAADLLGQKVKLTWKPSQALDIYLDTVTKDINFSDQANKFLENGNIVPVRLNGRQQVGPLQSLAGARPKDDVTVRLVETDLIREGGQPVLQTALEPIHTTGREYGLVKILGPDLTVNAPLPQECPGAAPCPTEYFRVQFFDSATRDFTGPTGTIRIPQQPMVNGERFFSNLRDLENSPGGSAGWYVYGARDDRGVFTVQALKPRAIFQLQPDQVIIGEEKGLNYIARQNWQATPQRKGTFQRVLVSPNGGSSDAARAQWQEGDYALVIHLFGGIGGENKEFTPAGTVTGHFAYGLGQVIQEPIANELQLNIQYQQIYAHNSGGIVSGTHDWHSFTGDMQRGWLGLRPISDVVVKLDSFIEPFQLGETTISLFRELLIQTQVLAARYRTGDGTGVAGVTPATSCVQDSNQALFIAMSETRRKIESHPEIVEWLRQNPDAPAVERVQRFISLGTALEQMLTPYGVIRPDWKNNAESLAGVAPRGAFISNQGLFSGALSWQTMMPRWGQDEVARIFLLNGAQLWFLRPNMVGGNDPRIEPIPPTTLFGGIPVLGQVVQRSADAFATWPTWPMVLLGLGALGLYALLAVPFGLKNGFLTQQNAVGNPIRFGLHALRLFFFPALVEETIFRVMLLPHPVEGIPGPIWLLWGTAGFVLFGLYHWALGKTFYKRADSTLSDPRFLILMGWLGLVLIGVYWITGSLWLITFIHWAVVLVWIYGFGGKARLPAGKSRRKGKKNTVDGDLVPAGG